MLRSTCFSAFAYIAAASMTDGGTTDFANSDGEIGVRRAVHKKHPLHSAESVIEEYRMVTEGGHILRHGVRAIENQKRYTADAWVRRARERVGKQKVAQRGAVDAGAPAAKEKAHQSGAQALVEKGRARGHDKAGVMYGIVTNALPRYRNLLETVLDTWAFAPRAEGRFFAIAGRDYPSQLKGEDDVVIAADCDDGPFGNACKEASLILEGRKRGASWLFIAGEDNYIDTRLADAFLQQQNADVPVGFGCVGCGKGNKTYGEQVYLHGGFCGGCGEAISGPALERLGSVGRHALVQEYGVEKQCDMSTSVAMRQRGIPLRKFPKRAHDYVHGMRYDTQAELEGKWPDAMTFHYITPPIMRWIHAKKNGTTGEAMELLESDAFKDGRVRAYNFEARQPI